MADVLVLGAGMTGLATAMLLAKDGHDVTVLERDPAPPPVPGEAAWTSWERRGVTQFRLPHLLLSRFRQDCDAELPDVSREIESAGGLRFNYLRYMLGPDVPPPEAVPDGDDDFEMLTGRRPVVEAAMASVASKTPRVQIRRGVAVGGLITGTNTHREVPHVVGARTTTGEKVHADLVVDAMGRRSPLARLLLQAGLRPPDEEIEDIGFRYYSRHFCAADGGSSLPEARVPSFLPVGSVILLSLPCDSGTWAVTLVALDEDRQLFGLSDPRRWSAAVRAIPGAAHWLDGEPLEDRVVTISGIEDRHRGFVLAGRPVASGVVAVGDAWACTNPTVGRGASLALMHAILLRRVLREVGADAPLVLAEAFHEATAGELYPWFAWTRDGDRLRRAEIRAVIGTAAPTTADDAWALEGALAAAARYDTDCFRALVRARAVLQPLEEASATPGLRERAFELAGSMSSAPSPWPSREQLVALAND